MNSILRRALSFITLMTLLTPCAWAQTPPSKVLTFLAVPQFAETRIHATWAPILAEVSQEIGVDIKLEFAPDIPTFEQQFEQGKPDLIYCNPYHAVMAKKAHGYVPVLRDKKNLKGLLIVEASGPYQSLRDLQGQTVLFPAPNAFGSSLYLRALLTEKEKIQFTPKYVKTHPNVLRGILRKEGVAGGMIAATLTAEDDKLEAQMKTIYETPSSPSHPVMVHPRVSEATRMRFAEALKKALLKFPKLAADVPMPDPITTSYRQDFQALENMGLEKYIVR